MTTSKERVTRLAALDRELRRLSDDEVIELIERLPPEPRAAVDRLAGPDGDDGRPNVIGLRASAARARMKGSLERVTALLSDACLSDCMEVLGDNADRPSELHLQAILPGLIARHGKATTRLMFATAVAGEVPSVVAITRTLKNEALFAGP